jgi:hypothetical protein
VARFYYQGSHSHPVRRTILVTESKRRYIRGYELRDGKLIRDISNAPVKTYRRDEIALYSDLGARKHRKPGPAMTTLTRAPLSDLITAGI